MLDKGTQDRIERLEREVARLRNQDRAPNVLVLRNGVSLPDQAENVGQIYIDISEGTVRIRFPDGSVREFTTEAVIISGDYLLDFSNEDNSFYLGAI